mmetsp:Transcript_29667/g.82826  ORF Transcript_29667/g.82826 Transcript_29667/m.82826 type:complete len:301 (+) Transcript_29667:104-1006(+)
MAMPSSSQGGYGYLTNDYGGSPGGHGASGGYGPPPGSGGYDVGGGHPTMGGMGGTAAGLKAMGAGNQMADVYFGASVCIVSGALLGGTSLFFSFKVVDWLGMSYLMVFGLTLAVLDTPFLKTLKFVSDAKMYIGKYIHFVARVTGKGVTLVFLGSALFLTMWDNMEGGFMRFLAVILSLFPTMVGLASVVIGVMKSNKLDKARRQLSPIIDHQYEQYAMSARGPSGGLSMLEFNSLTEKSSGIRFDSLDLKLIFNALVSNQGWRALQQSNQQGGYASGSDEVRIPKQDVLSWCKGGIVFL